MAEFTEVMRQAKRMCKSCASCDECAVSTNSELCPLVDHTVEQLPTDWNLDKLPEIERIVMQWAAEHPEPRYPTWEEWQKKNFPTAQDVMHPCAFMNRKEVEKARGVECGRTPCNTCARSPIPADIAEKLGIKPIGGTDE